jgi:hypothetical protein
MVSLFLFYQIVYNYFFLFITKVFDIFGSIQLFSYDESFLDYFFSFGRTRLFGDYTGNIVVFFMGLLLSIQFLFIIIILKDLIQILSII